MFVWSGADKICRYRTPYLSSNIILRGHQEFIIRTLGYGMAERRKQAQMPQSRSVCFLLGGGGMHEEC